MISTIKPRSTTYTITDLAREFNITTRSIRFYEDQGLLTPGRKGRRRIYSKRDRTRLQLILRGKRLGFSLSETRELFDLYDTARGEEKQLRHFIKILSERRALLEQQRQDIEAVLQEIGAAEAECFKLLMAQQHPPQPAEQTSAQAGPRPDLGDQPES